MIFLTSDAAKRTKLDNKLQRVPEAAPGAPEKLQAAATAAAAGFPAAGMALSADDIYAPRGLLAEQEPDLALPRKDAAQRNTARRLAGNATADLQSHPLPLPASTASSVISTDEAQREASFTDFAGTDREESLTESTPADTPGAAARVAAARGGKGNVPLSPQVAANEHSRNRTLIAGSPLATLSGRTSASSSLLGESHVPFKFSHFFMIPSKMQPMTLLKEISCRRAMLPHHLCRMRCNHGHGCRRIWPVIKEAIWRLQR